MENTRIEYEKPRILDYGDLLELTEAGSDGDALDADFPVGTKKSNLTFS